VHIVVTSAMTTSMVNNVAAKNRRPQKDPPENLADHSRLAESTSQYAAGKSHENHNWLDLTSSLRQNRPPQSVSPQAQPRTRNRSPRQGVPAPRATGLSFVSIDSTF